MNILQLDVAACRLCMFLTCVNLCTCDDDCVCFLCAGLVHICRFYSVFRVRVDVFVLFKRTYMKLL